MFKIGIALRNKVYLSLFLKLGLEKNIRAQLFFTNYQKEMTELIYPNCPK